MMPAARSTSRPVASSPASVTSRCPATAARTSESVRRVSSSTSAISSPARSWLPRSASRRARPALTVIVVSECPSRSCRSRAMRLRSFSAASRATSARAAASSMLDWMMREEAVHRQADEHDRQRVAVVEVGGPAGEHLRREQGDRRHRPDDRRRVPPQRGHRQHRDVDEEDERVLVREDGLDARSARTPPRRAARSGPSAVPSRWRSPTRSSRRTPRRLRIRR